MGETSGAKARYILLLWAARLKPRPFKAGKLRIKAGNLQTSKLQNIKTSKHQNFSSQHWFLQLIASYS
jgi:hypothetical protein